MGTYWGNFDIKHTRNLDSKPLNRTIPPIFYTVYVMLDAIIFYINWPQNNSNEWKLGRRNCAIIRSWDEKKFWNSNHHKRVVRIIIMSYVYWQCTYNLRKFVWKVFKYEFICGADKLLSYHSWNGVYSPLCHRKWLHYLGTVNQNSYY